MKKILSLLAAATGVVFPSVAHAGNTPTTGITRIIQIAVHDNGVVRLFFSNNIVNSPACSTQYPNAMAFLDSTNEGKALLALAMAFKMNQTPVNVVGKGTCAAFGILEDVSMIADG